MSKVIIENICNHNFSTDDFYCYMLLDPKDRSVFYIGKGRHRRIDSHQFPSTSKNHHKNHKIAKVVAESGFYIAQIVFTTNIEQQAYDHEEYLIDIYGLNNLTNIAPGGHAAPVPTSRRIVQYNLFGEVIATHSSYITAATSVSTNSSVPAQILECCRGAVATCYGFYWSYEGSCILRPKLKSRPIAQYGLQDNLVNRFISAADAGRAINQDGIDVIRSIKRGGTCGGYRWKFIDIINTI